MRITLTEEQGLYLIYEQHTHKLEMAIVLDNAAREKCSFLIVWHVS